MMPHNAPTCKEGIRFVFLVIGIDYETAFYAFLEQFSEEGSIHKNTKI